MSRRGKKRNQEKVNIKKLWFIQIISFTILFGLAGRLFYLQVIKHDFYSAEVLKQRQINIPVDSGRGTIFDRNFIPLTDRREEKVAIIYPQYFNLNESNISFLSKITDIQDQSLHNRIKNSNRTLEFPIKDNVNLEDKRIIETRGLFVVDKKMRYEDNSILTHVTGYINQVDFKGMSGIESVMDGVLSTDNRRSLVATVDGRKQFLPGEGYAVSMDNMDNKNLRLTIDYHIQKIIEETIDENDREGAIIVSNIKTGEVLGMVSRPNFNPNNIHYYINNEGDELYNKAIQMPVPPGSIFKIIVALEALNQDPLYADEIFTCEGFESVGDIKIKCSSYKRGGHGELTMDRAFSQSCNSVFIQLAEKIGTKNIIDMAEKLGFNSLVDIGLEEERSGNLPKGDELLGPAYGNIAIGQGEILVTPLQVNQMTQLIANNGLKKPLYIMEDIVDNNYNILKKSNQKNEDQVIDSEVIQILQDWMKKVMQEGTGRQVKELKYITAGKTGSAESVQNGLEVVHAWFTGYYPTNNPKYAITVFIQDGRSGGGVAVPIFRNIVEKMNKLGYK